PGARVAPHRDVPSRHPGECARNLRAVVAALGSHAAGPAREVPAEPAQNAVFAGAFSGLGVRRRAAASDSRLARDREMEADAALPSAARALAPLSRALRSGPSA